jgi:hypothetical protein
MGVNDWVWEMGKGKHLGNKEGIKGEGVIWELNFRRDRGFRYSRGVFGGSIAFKLFGMKFPDRLSSD